MEQDYNIHKEKQKYVINVTGYCMYSDFCVREDLMAWRFSQQIYQIYYAVVQKLLTEMRKEIWFWLKMSVMYTGQLVDLSLRLHWNFPKLKFGHSLNSFLFED
jgi:hypothetical protein